jgi:DNA repair protein RadC
MTEIRVSMERSYMPQSTSTTRPMRSCRVRELVIAYRPLRDPEGRTVTVPSVPLSSPPVAAQVIAPLLADHPVEIFAVACLSARNRILAWHIVSRGTRQSTLVSIPDVFMPACVTPGTVALLVAHNHPSGDPAPSEDDVAITSRLEAAAAVLDFSFHDHLIVGEEGRYYSFREAGRLRATPAVH